MKRILSFQFAYVFSIVFWANVPFIPAFNICFVCIIFIKTFFKTNALYNNAKVWEKNDK